MRTPTSIACLLALSATGLAAMALASGRSMPNQDGVPPGLIPAGSEIYIEVESGQAFNDYLDELMGAFGEEPGSALVEDLLEFIFPGDVVQIDLEQPFGFAFDLPGGMAQPQVYMIVATHDMDALLTTIDTENHGTLQSGNYLGVSLGATYPEEGWTDLEGLLKGPIRARIELAALVDVYDPMIEMVFEELIDVGS